MISLSIIIVNWNTNLLLQKCLRSMMESIRNIDCEVFIIDNGSSDGSQAMVSEHFPEVTLIDNQENVGFAKANNQAIRISRGKYILLLNSDAFLTKSALQKMLMVMESNQSIGIAGAQLVYPDGSLQVSHASLPTYWSEVESLFGIDKLNKTTVSSNGYDETGTVSGACMLIRKSLFDQIGLLDENFFMFSEEVDLCNRCHKAGLKVIHIPTAIVIHTQGGSTGLTAQRVKRLYMGKLLYFNKHFGKKAENRLKRTMLVATTLKGIIYGLSGIIGLEETRKSEFWWRLWVELRTIPE